MELISFLICFIVGMAIMAWLSRNWGYRIGVGMAKKAMKKSGLFEENKEEHE